MISQHPNLVHDLLNELQDDESHQHEFQGKVFIKNLPNKSN